MLYSIAFGYDLRSFIYFKIRYNVKKTVFDFL